MSDITTLLEEIERGLGEARAGGGDGAKKAKSRAQLRAIAKGLDAALVNGETVLRRMRKGDAAFTGQTDMVSKLAKVVKEIGDLADRFEKDWGPEDSILSL